MKTSYNLGLLFFLLVSCKVNQYTGNKTLNFYGNKTIFPVAFKQYTAFLTENPPVTNTEASKKIKTIGAKITAAAEAYFKHKGNPSYLADYVWEYNLVDNPQRNAWCMPGGKIVFYTGILPIAKTDDGIAAIMGHEVAHALANHGAQRMSANTLKAGLDLIAKKATQKQPENKQQRILMAYGVGSQVGLILPFNRKHETEADRIGLELMTIAGYNPQEAVGVWNRMKKAAEGKAPPEILSTHPSNERRIRSIQSHIKQADSLAKIIRK